MAKSAGRKARPPRPADEEAEDMEAQRDERLDEEIKEIDLSELPPDWQDVVERKIERLKGTSRGSKTEDRKTLDEVFDRGTLLTLWKFISNGILDTIDYPVSTGKEANVFHATARGGGSLAVKIFRTNTATFRAHLSYIEGDPRFGKVGHDRRSIVYTWAQKEYKNLQRYFDAGTRVPRPVAHQNNVLIMDFVGADGTPAPLLKEAPPEDPEAAYEDLMENYGLGFANGQLVHGDLSEYNVLNLDGELYVIDVAQAVLARHPMARDLLQRDARNLSRYFQRLGVKGATPEDALARMTPKAEDVE